MSKFVTSILSKSSAIAEKQNANKEFQEANDYYSRTLLKKLVKLFLEFPAWTSVMHDLYDKRSNLSTSSSSEVQYRIMRTNYGMDRPIAINQFLLLHLIVLEGFTKEARGLCKQLLESVIQNTDVIQCNVEKTETVVSRYSTDQLCQNSIKSLPNQSLANISPSIETISVDDSHDKFETIKKKEKKK